MEQTQVTQTQAPVSARPGWHRFLKRSRWEMVAVVVIAGVVNGNIVGKERVELGQQAIINGNISTPNLSMKPGATFQGDCRMLKSNS